MNRLSMKPLGQVAQFINGRAFKPSDWSTKGVPIIRIQNLTDPTAPANRFDGVYDNRHSIKAGDLLVSWSATLDVFVWDRGEAVLNQHIFRVIPDSSLVTKRYLFYALKSVMDELRSKTHGSTMKHITKGPFERTEIPVPSLSEQERIVQLMDEAGELRKLRAHADRRTAALIPALFQEMFGDPDTNPFGWPVKRAGDLMASCEYGTSQKANDDGRGVTVLRMGNVTTDGRLDLADLKSVELNDGKLARQRLQTGDVLFNRTNSRELVGKTGMWEGGFEAVAASYFIRVRFRSESEHPQHFTTFMNLPFMKRRLADIARGAVGQANINSRELQAIELPVPPLPLQEKFAKRVTEVRELEAEQTDSKSRLDDLFQSMFHRAFNGEL